ncbi:MAG: DUF1598 domain-containing protein, partial [Planctomycetales bacterium]|nr:DUF1598 domain-containing protein [Planctomycetales bacterium]
MLLTSKTGKRRAVLGTLAVTLVVAIISPGVWAQNDNNNTDDTGGDTTIIAGNLPGAGVVVDALGVVSMKRIDGTGELSRRRRLEAKSKLDANVAKASDSRKISLNRLANAVRESVDANQPITDELKFLAGLTKIQHVFYYPETKDIVIAGPAEGFMLDDMERPVGIFTGEPTLLLEDLVVALRTFGPGVKRIGSVGCSIDPTQDGLQRMQDFLQELSRRNLRPSDAEFIADGLQKSLGLQEVTITGIPANTHFANILVEADYRMKLIGIGLEVPPVRLKSYAERANAASLQRNAMQRWYFVPDYETVCISDDGLAAEIRGHGVKLVGANELVRADGTRMETNRVDQASERFCQDFTKQYPNLAAKAPVY